MLVELRPERGLSTRVKSLDRRDFLRLAAAATATAALGGCAVNPVTGGRQLMLVSEEQEIALDAENSPHQFSADYGPTQDAELNAYISSVGMSLAHKTHRTQMPYSFRVVNAPYVNAYAFPGGSIAATRGIMLEMDTEAELAALLGHELGHVNARHTASRMSKGMMVQAVASGAAIAASTQGAAAGQLASQLGGLGGTLLLAKYSRDDERQADDLGMDYSTKAGYPASGMIGLHEMLLEQHEKEPSRLEIMFSSHPMSSERLATAQESARDKYAFSNGYPANRERYMDKTADLRKIAPAIQAMQHGDKATAEKNLDKAEAYYGQALSAAPRDYAANVKMAMLKLSREDLAGAKHYAETAQEAYPQEATAYLLSGVAKLGGNDYGGAYAELSAYDKRLPGNPNVAWMQGFASEGMGHKQQAARHYVSYLRSVNSGQKAQYAYTRLKDWGFVQ